MNKMIIWKNALKKISIIIAIAVIITGTNCVSVLAAPHSDAEDVGVSETVEDETMPEASEDEAMPETSEDENMPDTAEDTTMSETAEVTPWNVYIYMIGGKPETENAVASDNIKEILGAKDSDDVRVILQAGGAKEWHLEDTDIEPAADRTRRYVINAADSECVYDEELTNMAESESLKDFMSWGMENYPSEKSLVVLYGEGKGFCGLGTDELYDDYLAITDIQTAFEKSSMHADILAFDASFMADLDVMNSLSSYADYMISSESIIADEGLDYDSIINAISDNSGCSAKYLAKKICDSYFEESRDVGESFVTLSAVDLNRVSPVVDAVAEYINALTGMYVNDEQGMSILLAMLLNKKDYGYIKERDLRTLSEDTLDIANTLEYEFTEDFDIAKEDIADAVRDCVYYRVQGENSRGNTGIAFAYLFSVSRNYARIYEEISAFPEYIALLDALKYDYHPEAGIYDDIPRNPEANREYFKALLELEENDEGFSTLVVSSGESGIANLDYCITETDEVGRVYTISQRSDLDILKGAGKYLTRFDGTVATIEGEPVVLMVDMEELDAAYYSIPVSVQNENGEFEDCTLFVGYDDSEMDEEVEESDRYAILGMHRNHYRNSDIKSYDIEPVPDGTVMRAAYPKDRGSDYMYGSEFIFSSESSIMLNPLKDGEYKLTYFVNSGLGAKVNSAAQTFYMRDGEVLMSDPDAEEEDENSYNGDNNYAEETEEVPSLPVVPYKEFYGMETPDRLRDIHYDEKDTVYEDSVEDDSSEPEKADVTMLLYICGSNLENPGCGGGSDTLRYGINVTDSDKVNIIAQTGGTDKWGYEGLDGDAIQRFEVHEGNLVEVSNTPVYNMSTGTAFSEFLNWGINNYPAEHYVIYVYDHGAAWYGTSWDDNFDSSHLSMKDWTYALESTGVVFDEVIFDLCLMATVEVASQIAPYVKYMTAYEVAQMSSDYEWDRVFEYLIKHADRFDAEAFGKVIVDMNADTWEEQLGGMIFQTMSLIDLSKIDKLNDALSSYASELNGLADDPEKLTKLVSGIEKSRCYSYEFQKDIVDVIEHSEGVSLKTKQDVINAVDDAVVYKRTQFDQLRNNGLSMYFDISGSYFQNSEYAALRPVEEYVEFLDKVTSRWHAPTDYYDDETVRNVNVSDFKIGYEILNDKNVSGIKITDNEEALYKKSYQILKYDEEQGTYFGYANRSDFTKGNDGEYYENFDGRVASIDGVPCYMTFDSFDGERAIYKIPASAYGEEVIVNVAFYPNELNDIESFDANPQNGTYEVIGISLSFDDMDVPEKNAEIFDYGTPITIMLPELSKNGEQLYKIESGTVTYSEDMSISFMDIEDGEYLLRYTIENGLKKRELSDDVPIVIKDGRIFSVGEE